MVFRSTLTFVGVPFDLDQFFELGFVTSDFTPTSGRQIRSDSAGWLATENLCDQHLYVVDDRY